MVCPFPILSGLMHLSQFLEDRRYLLRKTSPQPILQKIPEKVMVTNPATFLANREREEVVLNNGIYPGTPVLPVRI